MLYKIAAPVVLAAFLHGCVDKSAPEPCKPVPVCSYEECPTMECSSTNPRKPKLEVVDLHYNHSYDRLSAVIRDNEKKDSPLVRVILKGEREVSMEVYIRQTGQQLMEMVDGYKDERNGDVDWFKVGDNDFNLPRCFGIYNPEKKEWELGRSSPKSCDKPEKLAEQVQRLFTAYASILMPIKEKLSAKSEQEALRIDELEKL